MSYRPTTSQDDTSPEAVLGVDTHKEVHVAAVVSIHGVLLGSHSFPTTAEGYRTMLDWAATLGRVRQAGVEGTHSYGAALTRHLLTVGISVIEVNQPDKAHRRRHGKTDAIDAEAAARAVLSGRATAAAKTSDGHVERVRLFKTGQSLGHQGSDPGDQPAQSHPRRRRPNPARFPDRAQQPQARPPLR
ncbi:IS110 family transposase [Micromonospora echinaurantiaca]|nr:IS110 family transposase [Micromonospora echinaurantiaca]